MKKINKIITRLFFGGFDLRYGINGFAPIPKTYLYTTPLLAVIGYLTIVKNQFLQETTLGLICTALFLFIMYVVTIHFWVFPVKWGDLTDYQKWLYGNGKVKGHVATHIKMTEAQMAEWKALDIKARNA